MKGVITMKAIMENEKYKLVEGFGPYNNLRYEIIEKSFYYDNTFEKVHTSVLIFHGSNLSTVLNHFKKYYTDTTNKSYHKDFLVIA
jgi:hypothetical protein